MLGEALAQRRALFTIAALTVLGGGLAIAAAALASRWIAGLLAGDARRTGTEALLTLAAVAAARVLTGAGRDLAASDLAAAVKRTLRRRLAAALLGDGAPPASQRRSGELATRLDAGVEAVDAWFAQLLPGALMALVVPLAAIVAVSVRDPLSGLVLLLTAPLVPLFLALVGRGAAARARRQLGELGKLSARLLDLVQGLPTLRLLGRAADARREVAVASEAHRRATFDVLRVALLSALVLELAATLSTAVLAVSLGLRLLHGGVDFDVALFALLLAPEVFLPLRALGAAFHAATAGDAAAAVIYPVLDAAAAAASATAELPAVGGAAPPGLRLESVDFGWPGSRPLLRDVTLEVAAGEIVAVTGASGAGKSTLLQLVLGLARPTGGRVLVDGVPLAASGRAGWWRRLAWVPQRPLVVHGSMADNLRLGAPAASDGELAAAAREMSLGGLLDEAPEGLALDVGEGGRRLSLGQRQRLALARALLAAPGLVLLDEPTAHLDATTEAAVLAALRVALRGRTTVVVTHRAAAAAIADRVLRLEDGRLVEEAIGDSRCGDRCAAAGRPGEPPLLQAAR